ncbi:GNAT family N-acetyltransferase [Amycolatopsis sp. 195334CR]|uniref:GNAT family N-acetyltransferase n=1 Tax=Amycolatopsis sp. 195334CR TaxID=2814588 RepID=UPI001A8CC999|nr:GNAT family N-acetyltransferase [Amycolatopsis sp. 195334CR]MBN6041871.1 GNAT family N-acetyltransferase [Amycolatopsis sp. 195334CR]
MTLIVRPAEPSEFDAVLGPCVTAFADEAVSAWVVPDPVLRRERTLELFSTSLREAVEAGRLVVAFDGAFVAASIWFPWEGPVPEPDGDDRLATVLAATAARHPREPHVYLSSMAALPDRRGSGAGTALLRYGIQRAGGLPIYLEASTPRNRQLYLRHGFTDHGPPIPLPDNGPELQPMWRSPAGSGVGPAEAFPGFGLRQ